MCWLHESHMKEDSTNYLHKKFRTINSLLFINMYPPELQLPNGSVGLRSYLKDEVNAYLRG